MAAIDSDIMRIFINTLLNNSVVQQYIATDSNGIRAVRPYTGLQSGGVLPEIIVRVVEGNSEPQFPASKDLVYVTCYFDHKFTNQTFKVRNALKDAILGLFNRKGSDFNQIDLPTNTGVRVNQILKQSVDFDKEEAIDKNYIEIIFEVVRAENESFDPSDAGDAEWV